MNHLFICIISVIYYKTSIDYPYVKQITSYTVEEIMALSFVNGSTKIYVSFLLCIMLRLWDIKMDVCQPLTILQDGYVI